MLKGPKMIKSSAIKTSDVDSEAITASASSTNPTSTETAASRLEADNATRNIQEVEISTSNNHAKLDSRSSTTKPHVCTQCDRTFEHRYSLLRHSKKVHNMERLADDKGKCKCLECGARFRTQNLFRTHLATKHQMKFNTETIHFQHYSDFKTWLSIYEKDTVSNFHKGTCKKLKKGPPTEYWVCSRSGTYKEPNERKRKQKAIRTIKMEMNCTSTIKVMKTQLAAPKPTTAAQNQLLVAPKLLLAPATSTTQHQLNSTPVVSSATSTTQHQLNSTHLMSSVTAANSNVVNTLPMHMSPVSALICHTHYGHEIDVEYTWHKIPKKKDKRYEERNSRRKQVPTFRVDEVENVGEMKKHINNQLLRIAQQVEYSNSVNNPNRPDSNSQVEGLNGNMTALKTLYKDLETSFSTYNTLISASQSVVTVISQSSLTNLSVIGSSTDAPSASKRQNHTNANKHQSNNVVFHYNAH